MILFFEYNSVKMKSVQLHSSNHDLKLSITLRSIGREIGSTSSRICSFMAWIVVCGVISFIFQVTPQEKNACCEVWWTGRSGDISISGNHDLFGYNPFWYEHELLRGLPLHFFLNANTQEPWPIASQPAPNNTARLSSFLKSLLILPPLFICIFGKWNRQKILVSVIRMLHKISNEYVRRHCFDMRIKELAQTRGKFRNKIHMTDCSAYCRTITTPANFLV